MSGKIVLNIEVLKKNTDVSRKRIKECRAENAIIVKKDILAAATFQAEQEWKSIVSSIEELAGLGKSLYRHPVITSEFEKQIWKNREKLGSGETYFKGSYDLQRITVSNLYKDGAFKNVESSMAHYCYDPDDRYGTRYRIIELLVARKIARKALAQKLEVIFLNLAVVITSEYWKQQHYKSDSHHIPFLQLSWR